MLHIQITFTVSYTISIKEDLDADLNEFITALLEEGVRMEEDNGRIFLDIHVDTKEELYCPVDGTKLAKNGSAPRTCVVGGVVFIFKVQIYKCRCCEKRCKDPGDEAVLQYTHRGLPDILLPFKRTPAKAVLAAGEAEAERRKDPQDVDALRNAQERWKKMDMGYEQSTIRRWGIWYPKFRSQIAGILFGFAEKYHLIQFLFNSLALTGGCCDAPGQLVAAVHVILLKTGRLSI